MDKHDFDAMIEVDHATGKILAVYFRIRNGMATETKEFADGKAFANYGAGGQLLGVEIIAPCEVRVLDQIARKEPKAKRFIRQSIPYEMLVAEKRAG